MFQWSGLQPELVWGLYTRGLGVVCLCVFASLSLEVTAWPQAYLDAFANPEAAASELSVLTPETGLYYLAIFRFERMSFEARKLRLIEAFSPPYAGTALTPKPATPTSRKLRLARLSDLISGYLNLLPAVRDGLNGPGFESGGRESYPTFAQLPSGEVVLCRKRSASRRYRPSPHSRSWNRMRLQARKV